MGLFDGLLLYIEEKAVQEGRLSKPLKREMSCKNCKEKFTFTLKEFMQFKKHCPNCNTINDLELDTSEEC